MTDFLNAAFYENDLFIFDSERIVEYARNCLSDDAPYFGKPQGTRTPEAERVAICTNDPKFGWNLVNSFIKAGKELPLMIEELSLHRAYAQVADNEFDPHVVDARALTHPQNRAQCNLLKGLIMSRDISLSRVAEWMCIPEDTLYLFCDLFFNVRNCWHQPGYIANLLYAKTRLVTYREDYMENADPGLMLMRVGYEYGADKVAELAGFSFKGKAKVPTPVLCDEFESLVMKNGVTLASLGYLNAKSHAGIAHAKALLAANRKAQEKSNVVADEVMGLGALSAAPGLGKSIMDILKEMQAPDVATRRELLRQKFENDARKEKAAKAEK